MNYQKEKNMKKLVIFRCQHCGNICIKLIDSGVPVFCCGEPMQALIPNTNDGAMEKHVPVILENENSVKITVGSNLHPMTDEHYIQFIILQTNLGYYVKHLSPNTEPIVEFCLTQNETPICAYSYCNLHSLWISNN